MEPVRERFRAEQRALGRHNYFLKWVRCHLSPARPERAQQVVEQLRPLAEDKPDPVEPTQDRLVQDRLVQPLHQTVAFAVALGRQLCPPFVAQPGVRQPWHHQQRPERRLLVRPLPAVD